MRFLGTVIVAVFVCAPSATVFSQPSCKGPFPALVPTKKVALKIFNAVADQLEGPAKRKVYVVKFLDDLYANKSSGEASSWTVFEGLKGCENPIKDHTDKAGRRYIPVCFGGGGLGMKIDKCTAAISDVAFQR